MVCAPAAWGTHLVHFTGSKDHNIALRGMALDRGWSLSEKGWKVIDTGELLLDAEEADVYERLGLPWIAPELREGDGEIEAALAGPLPTLVSARRRARRHAHPLRLDRWRRLDRGHGARGTRPRPRVHRAHRPFAVARRDPRPHARPRRGAAAGDRAAQRRARAVPHPARHGARDPRGRDARLPRRAARPLRRRHRQHPHRPGPVVGAAHPARACRDRAPARRRARPSVGSDREPPRSAAARLAARVRGRREHGTALEINGSPRLDLDDSLARAAGVPARG